MRAAVTFNPKQHDNKVPLEDLRTGDWYTHPMGNGEFSSAYMITGRTDYDCMTNVRVEDGMVGKDRLTCMVVPIEVQIEWRVLE